MFRSGEKDKLPEGRENILEVEMGNKVPSLMAGLFRWTCRLVLGRLHDLAARNLEVRSNDKMPLEGKERRCAQVLELRSRGRSNYLRHSLAILNRRRQPLGILRTVFQQWQLCSSVCKGRALYPFAALSARRLRNYLGCHTSCNAHRDESRRSAYMQWRNWYTPS